jgi:hypothetical protein
MRHPKTRDWSFLLPTGRTTKVQLSEPLAAATHGSFSIPIEKPSAGEGAVGSDRLSLLHAATPISKDTHTAKADDGGPNDMPMKIIGLTRSIDQCGKLCAWFANRIDRDLCRGLIALPFENAAAQDNAALMGEGAGVPGSRSSGRARPV